MMQNRKNKATRGMIVNVILSCLAVGGLLTVAAIAPNALQALQLLGIRKGKYRFNSYIKSTLGKLHQKGFIVFKQEGENRYIVLTDKGKRALVEHQARNFKLSASEGKWDNKWRVVIFDIKEYRRSERDLLRDSLVNIGFVKIQNSVWVFPYECEEFIFLLKTDFEFGKAVLFLVVEKLENDKWLRKRFDLPD